MLYNGGGQMIYRSDAAQVGIAGEAILGAPVGPDGNVLSPPSGQKDVTFIYSAQTQPVTAIKLTEGDTLLGTALLSSGTPAKAFQVKAIAPNIFQIWLLQLAGPSSLRIALTGLVTLIVTAMLAAWFLGRALLRPLRATSRAARQIAAGDLDFTLPHSHVREVAEVGVAFRAMGDALKASLKRQAAEEEQKDWMDGDEDERCHGRQADGKVNSTHRAAPVHVSITAMPARW